METGQCRCVDGPCRTRTLRASAREHTALPAGRHSEGERSTMEQQAERLQQRVTLFALGHSYSSLLVKM